LLLSAATLLTALSALLAALLLATLALLRICHEVLSIRGEFPRAYNSSLQGKFLHPQGSSLTMLLIEQNHFRKNSTQNKCAPQVPVGRAAASNFCTNCCNSSAFRSLTAKKSRPCAVQCRMLKPCIVSKPGTRYSEPSLLSTNKLITCIRRRYTMDATGLPST